LSSPYWRNGGNNRGQYNLNWQQRLVVLTIPSAYLIKPENSAPQATDSQAAQQAFSRCIPQAFDSIEPDNKGFGNSDKQVTDFKTYRPHQQEQIRAGNNVRNRPSPV
jgi:hypothetical protein